MIIKEAGLYAILADYPPNNVFKEWRYLVVDTECDDSLVFPRMANLQPAYDPKKQKIVEQITVREADVLLDWVVQDLTEQEISANKRPDGAGFQREMISNPELLAIYQKTLSNRDAQVWLNEVRAALIIFTTGGFAFAINALAQSLQLTNEEIQLLNLVLYKYDLELITWQP
jgi:hypothetical protein